MRMLGLRINRFSGRKKKDVYYLVVGVHSVDGLRGIHHYDKNFNHIEFYDLKTIYTSTGQTFPGTSSPRDIGIDSDGKLYIIDVGYGSRLYRLNKDFSLDTTFISPSASYLDVDTNTDYPESVEVVDGKIYIGDRANTVNVFNLSNGAFIETIDLSAQLTQNLVGAIRKTGDFFFVTDKNKVFKYTNEWVYTGIFFSTTFTAESLLHGGNLYGLTKIQAGWAACEINRNEFLLYDENFSNISYTPFTVIDSARGIIAFPVLRE